MGLVFDSSVLIAAERGNFDLERFVLEEASMKPVYISAITASELLLGVHRAIPEKRAKREAFVESILANTPSLDFDLPTARHHALIWSKLASTGSMIGPNDLIIAATCLRYSQKLATLNEKEFARVEGLELADARKFANPS